MGKTYAQELHIFIEVRAEKSLADKKRQSLYRTGLQKALRKCPWYFLTIDLEGHPSLSRFYEVGQHFGDEDTNLRKNKRHIQSTTAGES